MVPFIDDGEFPGYASHVMSGLGQKIDGTLREYGLFHETSLVHMPDNLSFEQASTLSCSAVTAWNALHGLLGKEVKKGDTVLIQGSGGVSIAALQFAHVAGATVIATTSSEEKAARLRALGADHVINYKTDPAWGETAKSLTLNNRGVDHVVDVGGTATLAQSFKAVCVNGLITMAGLVGGESNTPLPSLLDCLYGACIVRGVVLATRQQFREMNSAIEAAKIEPVIDEKVFGLRDVKDALKRLEEQKHFSKIVIKIAE